MAALGVLTVSVVLLSVRLMDQPRYVTEPDKQYDFIVGKSVRGVIVVKILIQLNHLLFFLKKFSVGAGTAGCVLAERLSANPLNRVLLIESGGDAPWYSWIPFASPLLQVSRHDWEYRTVTQKHAAGALRNRVNTIIRQRLNGLTRCRIDLTFFVVMILKLEINV